MGPGGSYEPNRKAQEQADGDEKQAHRAPPQAARRVGGEQRSLAPAPIGQHLLEAFGHVHQFFQNALRHDAAPPPKRRHCEGNITLQGPGCSTHSMLKTLMADAPSAPHAGTLGLKLAPPARLGQQVVREALLHKIEQEQGARLVLVCAPAGFGKTTTLEQCRHRLAEQGLATAWLTLDAQDNDRSRFLAGLRAALETLPGHNALSAAPPAFPQGATAPSDGALEVIEAYAAITCPFALFLDELESVQDAGVLALIGELVARLPRNGRLVVASRSRPALPLASLRAHSQLLEIDAEHLRFSLLETTRFFATGPVEMPPQVLRRLHDKSEGWAAALWLASLALERPQANPALIEHFSGSHLALADYLAEDVLAGLAPQLRQFLLCTSVLKHLHAPICQALLPQADAGEMLAQLSAANLFLTPIPGAPGTFRYHALFAGFLRAQLAREQPQQVKVLHLAAAGWYEAQQRPVPAIDHALEGGDLPHALRLLDAHAMPLLMQGRLRLLARWFGELPAAALQAHPRLHAIGLWALCLTAGPVEAMQRLDASGLHQCADPVARELADGLQPTVLAMLDRAEEAYACGRPLLSRLSGEASFANVLLISSMANVATVLGRNQEARQLLDAGRRAQGREPSAFSLMYTDSVDSIIDLLEGRLRQAGARLRLAVRPGSHSTAAASHAGGNAWAGMLYAASVYESGELAQAQQLLRVYLPQVCDAGLPDHMILGHVMLARIAMSDPQGATRALQELAELESLGHRRGLLRVVASARLERARMAMLQGDAAGADAELRRADDAALWQRVATECHVANDLESLTLSRLRRAVLLGDAAAALPQIEREIAVATASSSHRRVLLLRLLEAMASLRRGDSTQALTRFKLVMKHCAREGFVRLLVDEGGLAGELLQRFLGQDAEALRRDPLLTDHARRIAQAFGPLPEPVNRAHGSAHLTAQELRVLHSVAEGLDNDAVGERLGVSRSTVRTHLRNISTKLGAQNRTQAVSLARRLGLLG